MRQFTKPLQADLAEFFRNEAQACKHDNIQDFMAYSLMATQIMQLPTVDHNQEHYHRLVEVTRPPEKRMFTPSQIDEILAMLDEAGDE